MTWSNNSHQKLSLTRQVCSTDLGEYDIQDPLQGNLYVALNLYIALNFYITVNLRLAVNLYITANRYLTVSLYITGNLYLFI